MVSKWLPGTKYWLSWTFNFIHSPFRVSLGNCGGLVTFVLSVLWVPSALCSARPGFTGHSFSHISSQLYCGSWSLCWFLPPRLWGPPLDLFSLELPVISLAVSFSWPGPSILFIGPFVFHWETVVNRSPFSFQFSGYPQHPAVLDLALLGIPFHSFARAYDPSGMPRPAILSGTSNHTRLFVQVTAIAILLAPNLGILASLYMSIPITLSATMKSKKSPIPKIVSRPSKWPWLASCSSVDVIAMSTTAAPFLAWCLFLSYQDLFL
jgi:hypothetical protein